MTLVSNLSKKYLSPLLNKKGFTKTALAWKRNSGEFIHLVNIQRSKHNTPNVIRLTVNVGVFSPEAHFLIWNKKTRQSFIEADCLVNERLGSISAIMKGEIGNDLWWELKSERDVENAGNQIVEMIEKYALPFLEYVDSYEHVDEYIENKYSIRQLTGLTGLFAGFVKTKVGNQREAMNILDSMIDSKNLAWADKAKEFKTVLLK